MSPAQYSASTLSQAGAPGARVTPVVITESFAGGDDDPIFTPQQREELAMRRFNPLAALTAQSLTSALDGFDVGDLAPAARLWQKLAERERWLSTVKSKREEAISLRPTLIEKTEDSPEADDQQAVLEAFLANIRGGHALDRHVTGGFALVVQQMMENVSFKYACHHLRWQPNAANTIKLPSGQNVPSLGLTCEYVPLEYFEARTGELRFLGVDQGYTGEPLAPDQWMVSAGPGLMRAASIAIYEARLARHDRLNLSEKWGQPAVLGHTTANKASEAGRAMKAAVTTVASNYRGVIYGSDRNAIEPFWPTGSGGAGGTPQKEIMDDVQRDIVTLYIGSDLSTISRGGSEKSVGASVQGESEADKQRADCVRIAESFNTTILPIVIKWYFGENARILVKLVIEAPDNEDRTKLAEAVKSVVEMGGNVPIAPVAKRLNVPIAKEGEEVFRKPATAPIALATNAAQTPDQPLLGKFLARSREVFGHALERDLAPLRSALALLLQPDGNETEESFRARVRQLYERLPGIGREVVSAQHSAQALYRILSAAAASGLNPNDDPNR